MGKPTIKAAIFDVDGCLLQAYDEHGRYLWSRTAKQDLGLTGQHFARIFSKEWAQLIRGQKSLENHLDTIFQEEIFRSLNITPAQYIQYWLMMDSNINKTVLQIIQKIKVPCYLATNQEAVRGAHIVSILGPYFEGCFASHAVGFAKPEQEFFKHIEHTLNLHSDQLLLIDDMADNTNGALRCGWSVFHYQNHPDQLVQFLKHGNMLV
jgi:putative hydrolase of the HAD superfamily